MKKMMSLFMGVFILFSLAACGNSVSPVTFSLPDDVTEANVTHVISGQVSEGSVLGNDLLLLKEWLSGLQCIQKPLNKGTSPVKNLRVVKHIGLHLKEMTGWLFPM